MLAPKGAKLNLPAPSAGGKAGGLKLNLPPPSGSEAEKPKKSTADAAPATSNRLGFALPPPKSSGVLGGLPPPKQQVAIPTPEPTPATTSQQPAPASAPTSYTCEE